MFDPIISTDSLDLGYELTPTLRTRILTEFKQFLEQRPQMLASNPKFAATIHAIGEEDLSLGDTDYVYTYGYAVARGSATGHAQRDPNVTASIEFPVQTDRTYMSAESSRIAIYPRFGEQAKKMGLDPYWEESYFDLARAKAQRYAELHFTARGFVCDKSDVACVIYYPEKDPIVYKKYPIYANVMTKDGAKRRLLGYYDAEKDTVEFLKIDPPPSAKEKARAVLIKLLIAAGILAAVCLFGYFILF